jgi:hypothetical protein
MTVHAAGILRVLEFVGTGRGFEQARKANFVGVSRDFVNRRSCWHSMNRHGVVFSQNKDAKKCL